MKFQSLVFCLVIVITATTSAVAQVQIELPDSVDSEPLPLTNPAAQSKITESLGDDGLPESEREPTGDLILDDVLQIIRERGSVLKGSQLDPPSLPARLPASTSDPRPQKSAYSLAEQLLRTARNLEARNSTDSETVQLVIAMRRHATKLLIDAFSSDTSAPIP